MCQSGDAEESYHTGGKKRERERNACKVEMRGTVSEERRSCCCCSCPYADSLKTELNPLYVPDHRSSVEEIAKEPFFYTAVLCSNGRGLLPGFSHRENLSDFDTNTTGLRNFSAALSVHVYCFPCALEKGKFSKRYETATGGVAKNQPFGASWIFDC